MANKPTLYSHRRKGDGSYDLICLTCLATVGGSKPDGQLRGNGKGHICDSAFLAERGIFTQGECMLRLAPPLPDARPYPRSEEAA